jgi:hypothetical protein
MIGTGPFEFSLARLDLAESELLLLKIEFKDE